MLALVLAVLVKRAAAGLLPVRLIACTLLGSTAGLSTTALTGLGEGWGLPVALWGLAVVRRLLTGVMSSARRVCTAVQRLKEELQAGLSAMLLEMLDLLLALPEPTAELGTVLVLPLLAATERAEGPSAWSGCCTGVNCRGTNAAEDIVTADCTAGEEVDPCASGKERPGLDPWSETDITLCTGGSATRAVGVWPNALGPIKLPLRWLPTALSGEGAVGLLANARTEAVGDTTWVLTAVAAASEGRGMEKQPTALSLLPSALAGDNRSNAGGVPGEASNPRLLLVLVADLLPVTTTLGKLVRGLGQSEGERCRKADRWRPAADVGGVALP